MIVKIQIPLATSDTQAMALVYNEDRSFQATVPIESIMEFFPERVDKWFFDAEVQPDGSIKILKRADWHDW